MKASHSNRKCRASAPLSQRVVPPSTIQPHKLIIMWLRTRMLLWKIAALWGLILLSTLLAAPELRHSVPTMVYTATLALLMIMAFRLWDDLTDIAFDRQRPVERVLVRHSAPNTRAILHWVTASLLALTGLLLYFFHGWPTTLALLLLVLCMLTLYATLPALTPQRKLRNTLVLLKYPAMLIVLSGGQINITGLIIAAILYALLVIYENYTA